MVEVYLAGYNVDTDTLRELDGKGPRNYALTPETLSAAYARISRNPKPVNELRKIAREEVEKARVSNRRIIFDMGHHSVAEHAVFNFDLIGVSRLAIETIEQFRLCSFTEKSQRYIKLEGNYVVPKELVELGLDKEFTKVVDKQNQVYNSIYRDLVGNQPGNSGMDPAKFSRKQSKAKAKEDARYITCLATKGQLGMTVNARNLELMIRRFSAHPLRELRELGEKLYNLVLPVAPSIILFPDPTEFDKATRGELQDYSKKLLKDIQTQTGETTDHVKLIHYTPEADEKIIAALIHGVSSVPMEKCLEKTRSMTHSDKLNFMKTTMKHLEFYDTVAREFEYVNVIFELVISAACFAQLKRHRMATITTQDYMPSLGVTLPPSVIHAGQTERFHDMTRETNKLYYKIAKTNPMAATYILTNAHRRRLLFKMNARAFYHLSRLRQDKHAQWEIRNITNQMVEKTQKIMPLTMSLACGKDQYTTVYKEVFGKEPKFQVPEE